jgi:hypothetical protein
MQRTLRDLLNAAASFKQSADSFMSHDHESVNL